MRKTIKKLLKIFIRIDKIPFTDNGKSVEYCTMYICGLAIASNVYPVKTQETLKSQSCQS